MIRKPKKHPEPGPTAAAGPAATLAQAKSDFTAEGSPPPGQVSGTDPAPASNAAVTPPSSVAPAKEATPGRRQPPAPAGPARRASKRNPTAWRGNG